MKLFLPTNIKMPTIGGIILIFSRKNFLLSSAVLEESLNSGIYYATEHKIFNFFPEIADAFNDVKSYDKRDWSSKTQTNLYLDS